jgi:hypothetical protein
MAKVTVTRNGRTLEVSPQHFRLALRDRGWELASDLKAEKPKKAKAEPEPAAESEE